MYFITLSIKWHICNDIEYSLKIDMYYTNWTKYIQWGVALLAIGNNS